MTLRERDFLSLAMVGLTSLSQLPHILCPSFLLVYRVSSRLRLDLIVAHAFAQRSIRFAPPTSTYRAERDCAHVPDSSVRLMTRDEFNQRHSTTISTLNDDVALYWTSAKSMYKLCDRRCFPFRLDYICHD